MGDLIFPSSLVVLAQLLGERLNGPQAQAAEIDRPVVTLALRRHYVGPLLYGTAVTGERSIADDLLSELEQSYRANVRRNASALARLDQIKAAFAAHGINWMALKGVTQATQLYTDPAWRESSDIDILVTPNEFLRAIDTLVASGFIASNPPIPSIRFLRKPIWRAVRDVTLIARDDHRCAVELHRRLFFASGKRAQALKFATSEGTFKTPALGPDLTFYLIAHGAASFWVRLKWLVDLVPLFAKLNDGEKFAILERAREAGAESAVAASLLLLHALFPFVALGPLAPWVEHKRSERHVKQRLQRYAEMISLEHDWKRSPLDNALMALESSWMLFEAPSTRARILMSAFPSSMARKIAATLSKSDRALTMSEAP
ncbi:MAG TPA: nucleotidyltransferase family protein [Rhizomicrobium sp.]